MKKSFKVILILLLMLSSGQSISAHTNDRNDYQKQSYTNFDLEKLTDLYLEGLEQRGHALYNDNNVITGEEREVLEYTLVSAEWVVSNPNEASDTYNLNVLNQLDAIVVKIRTKYIHYSNEPLVDVQITKLPKKQFFKIGEGLDELPGGRILVTTTSGKTYELAILRDLIVQDYPMFDFGHLGFVQLNFKISNLSYSYKIVVGLYYDVHPHHEFSQYIQVMYLYGLMTGYTDGSGLFGMHNPITRAEFSALLGRFYENIMEEIIPDTTETSYPDVPGNHWAANYISFLKEKGIITGFEDGYFYPNGQITRAQLSAMIGRMDVITYGSDATYFDDVPDTHWAAEHIYLLSSNKIVSGYPNGRFGPNDSATRGQIAKIISNLLQIMIHE